MKKKEKEVEQLEVVDEIHKKFGTELLMNLKATGKQYPSIATGISSLDHFVLGIGGFARGRIIEVFGPESSGKTTLALQVVASAQKMGERAAYIDMEHALDPAWMEKNKVDTEALLVSQPDYGEQALEIVEALVNSGKFSVIVVDSVAALVPKAELEGDMGSSFMGVHARLMSQAMRKLTGVVARSNTCLIFINQIRDKIGVMFGSPETTTGGRALKFYASVRLDIRRIAGIKSGEEITANRVKIKCVKNKLSAPFRETEVDLAFGTGFDKMKDLIEYASGKGVITKAGSWFSYKDEKLGQGTAGAAVAIAEKGLLETITKELRNK